MEGCIKPRRFPFGSFCICVKVRAKYKPKEFLDKPPIEIHNIITPLTSECIKERGQIWHDDTTEEK